MSPEVGVSEDRQSGYRVVFSSDAVAVRSEPGLIVISRSRDSWNDFGFQIHVDILIIPQKPHSRIEPLQLTGFLGFVERSGRNQDTRVLQDLLAAAEAVELVGDRAPAFFTMLPDMAGYRELVGQFGPDESRKVLSALKDVVEAGFSGVDKVWLRQATGTQIFKQAFVRTAEAFFAWKNAEMLLRGVTFEETGRLSKVLQIEFTLAGRPAPHRIEFSFAHDDPVLPKRFAVVIGENGVGKSQTLRQIVDAAIRGQRSLTDGQGGRPSFNRVLAFEATASSYAFPVERRRGSKVWYRRFSLNGPGLGRRRQKTAELVIELARSEERLLSESRFIIFRQALLAIDSPEELALVVDDGSGLAVPIFELLRGSEQARLDRFASVDTGEDVVRIIQGELYPLSSGELAFLRFAALASLYIENSSILLFDEPETHLHPSFISQFVLLLDKLLERTGSAAIIATHSVYFVREAFEDQIRILRARPDRSIDVEIPRMRTFGADVGTISYFVFDEDKPSRLAQQVERRIADESQDWGDTFEKYRQELSPELLGEIRADLEDSPNGPTT